MDAQQQEKLAGLLDRIKGWTDEQLEANTMDPVIKMLITSLLSEVQGIQDSLEQMGQRVLERYYEDFIPRRLSSAMPAITLVQPSLKSLSKVEITAVDSMFSFSFKSPNQKLPINYVPLLRSNVYPVEIGALFTHRLFRARDFLTNEVLPKEKANVVWLGLSLSGEVDSLGGLTILVKGTDGVAPVSISIGDTGNKLEFAGMDRIEDIEMIEPFDAQQTSGYFLSILQNWKESLTEMEDSTLIYLIDNRKDRDLFRTKSYPSVFQFCLTSEAIDAIPGEILWLKLTFPENYVVTDKFEVVFNVFPVVNVDLNQIILTDASPIAKLQKYDDSFFMGVLQPSNNDKRGGYGKEWEEFLIRDFDTSCYHEGDLYRDVRNLFHHFVEDYYAFLDFNGIKDGELIRRLRETVNKIGKAVGRANSRYNYDSGTYAMKNIAFPERTSATRVAYMTTRGSAGNEPKLGSTLENKRIPAFDKVVAVMSDASCGRDKASVDERYELLRYYAMTNDRLYTKMDIDAFLRKELLSEFGKDEYPRIDIRIHIEGHAGDRGIRRGLYIDLLFRDKKNYDRAQETSLAVRVRNRICTRSCISMPIEIALVNLDK